MFSPRDPGEARLEIGKAAQLDLKDSYVLHVGGNQWYKNRIGVIEIYNAWRELEAAGLPLLMIGPPASPALEAAWQASPFKKDIHLLSGLDDQAVRAGYAGASVFLFPSLAEGFGWPIAEAMASGCPVITTDEAPMTEVAGDAAWLIPKRPEAKEKLATWAADGALVLRNLLKASTIERAKIIASGIENARRFDADVALDQIESVYLRILQHRTLPPQPKIEAS